MVLPMAIHPTEKQILTENIVEKRSSFLTVRRAVWM